MTVVLRLARLLKGLNADIVHGFLFSAEIASRLAGRMAGTKCVVGSERNANRRIAARHAFAYRLTQRCTDRIVANSHAGAESNARAFNRALSNYRVVHNGVDTDRFRPQDPTAARSALGIPQDCAIIGNVSNFKPQKNHVMLFRAFRRVLDVYPQARLVLVGDEPVDSRGRHGSYQAEVSRVMHELAIREHCMFLGHRNDIEQLYPAFDVTVLSSLHEGTPNVLLESMACGVPVIATRVCDNEYVVKDGEVGYLVDVGQEAAMGDCIRLMLRDKTRRQGMGSHARQWVCREFSSKRLAEKMEAVYVELLAECGSRHAGYKTECGRGLPGGERTDSEWQGSKSIRSRSE
jgi:glycosyltransferase involved in cell wall biosynthesis